MVCGAKEKGMVLPIELAGFLCCVALVCTASTSETLLALCRLLIPHWSSMCSILSIPVFSRKELFFFQRKIIG